MALNEAQVAYDMICFCPSTYSLPGTEFELTHWDSAASSGIATDAPSCLTAGGTRVLGSCGVAAAPTRNPSAGRPGSRTCGRAPGDGGDENWPPGRSARPSGGGCAARGI